jgi:hypothetical protein
VDAVGEESRAGRVVGIDSIRPWNKGDNPRRGNLEEIKASLERFGQQFPIVVFHDGRIVVGNHRWIAAKELDWQQIWVVDFQGTEEEAQAYVLRDNRTHEKGYTDKEALHNLLTKMMYAGQLDGTGYSPDDIDDLLEEVSAVIEEEPEFTGDFAEAPETTADRFKVSEHKPHDQFVLLYPPDQAEDFRMHVKELGRRWGLGPNDVPREAVKRAYLSTMGAGDGSDEIPF